MAAADILAFTAFALVCRKKIWSAPSWSQRTKNGRSPTPLLVRSPVTLLTISSADGQEVARTELMTAWSKP
ncbi:hypothetical protein [Nonomuraea fuscirosea]